VEKYSSVVFPAPLMSTIREPGSFLARESQAADELHPNGPAAPTSVPLAGTSQT
jgi:hypothetical protein